MSPKKSTRRPKVRRFSVGGKVYVQFGNSRRLARIVEDRGTIGLGGRRLLRVVFADGDDAGEQAFEVPAAEVKPAKFSTLVRRSSKAKTHA